MSTTLRVPTFVIITGAGRGIGRETAIQLARKVHPTSYIYLIDILKDGIEDTAQVIKRDVSDERLNVRCLVADLSDSKSVTELKNSIFVQDLDASIFSHVMIIHNAAAFYLIERRARELDDVESMQKYFLLNITSAIMLTSGFLQHFDKKCNLRRTVVEITSYAAVSPIQSLHLYGAVKAGRDMFFRVMALEEPGVRFLIFDPGSVDTKLFRDASGSHDSTFRSVLEKIEKQSYLLSPEQSAGALVKTIEEDNYETAATIHSYDVLGIKVDF